MVMMMRIRRMIMMMMIKKIRMLILDACRGKYRCHACQDYPQSPEASLSAWNNNQMVISKIKINILQGNFLTEFMNDKSKKLIQKISKRHCIMTVNKYQANCCQNFLEIPVWTINDSCTFLRQGLKLTWDWFQTFWISIKEIQVVKFSNL